MGFGLLFVTQVYDPRDPNLGFTSAWVEAFAEEWETIHVVCWRATQVSSKRIRIHVLPEGAIRRAFALMALSWRLRKEVAAVFVHMIPTVLAVLGWWWRLLGLRVGLWYTHGTVSVALRLAVVWAHVVFTANTQSFQLASSKIRAIGHGIDLHRFTPDPSFKRSQTVLFAGRITPRKDVERFLSIVAELSRSFPRLRAIIAGAPRLETDEVYAKNMRLLVQQKGLEDRVAWVGNVVGDELINLYRSAGVFLSTSKTGSLDKVVLEALACGTPVVASGSAYQGIPHVYVAAEDAAIVETLSTLLRDLRAVDARVYLEQEASLFVLAQRVKLGLVEGLPKR